METLQDAWAALHSPWTLFALAVVAAVLVAARLNAGRAELAQLRREKAEAAFRAAALLVAEQERAGKLEERLTGLSAELREAVARADQLGSGVRVVEIVRAGTAPTPATDKPRGAEGAPGAGAEGGQGAGGPAEGATTPRQRRACARPCLPLGRRRPGEHPGRGGPAGDPGRAPGWS